MDKQLSILNDLRELERFLLPYKDLPDYFYKGGILKPGENISVENMQAMLNGEVFILTTTPPCIIIRDALGTIREKKYV